MISKYISKKRKRGRHRQRRKHTHHHLREWLWPSMGLLAALRWFELYIKRHNGTAHKAAMGVAIGVGASFMPFLGFHTIFVLVLAALLRGSFWIGMIATAFGNPWTFPFIFGWDLHFGQWLLGVEEKHTVLPKLPSVENFFDELPLLWDAYLWPMTVGAVPTGILFGTLFYFLTKKSIETYQHNRKNRIEEARKRHKQKKLNKK